MSANKNVPKMLIKVSSVSMPNFINIDQCQKFLENFPTGKRSPGGLLV